LELFTIQTTQTAVDDLNHIPKELRNKILPDIRNLSSNPFLFGSNVKKLKGFKPLRYRLHFGDYRILYRVQGQLITIMRVIGRKELEKVIKRLKL
jgi:mRNA-degrading endonuclease RelE of RelBE toxin-antitoxin system